MRSVSFLWKRKEKRMPDVSEGSSQECPKLSSASTETVRQMVPRDDVSSEGRLSHCASFEDNIQRRPLAHAARDGECSTSGRVSESSTETYRQHTRKRSRSLDAHQASLDSTHQSSSLLVAPQISVAGSRNPSNRSKSAARGLSSVSAHNLRGCSDRTQPSSVTFDSSRFPDNMPELDGVWQDFLQEVHEDIPLPRPSMPRKSSRNSLASDTSLSPIHPSSSTHFFTQRTDSQPSVSTLRSAVDKNLPCLPTNVRPHLSKSTSHLQPLRPSRATSNPTQKITVERNSLSPKDRKPIPSSDTLAMFPSPPPLSQNHQYHSPHTKPRPQVPGIITPEYTPTSTPISLTFIKPPHSPSSPTASSPASILKKPSHFQSCALPTPPVSPESPRFPRKPSTLVHSPIQIDNDPCETNRMKRSRSFASPSLISKPSFTQLPPSAGKPATDCMTRALSQPEVQTLRASRSHALLSASEIPRSICRSRVVPSLSVTTDQARASSRPARTVQWGYAY